MSDTNNRDLNYRSSLDRARRRRNRNRYQRYALIGGGVLIVLLLLIALILAVVKPASSENAEEETETAAEAALSPEEQDIITQLYILDKSERQACAALQLARTTFQRRKKALLEKLRNLLDENS